MMKIMIAMIIMGGLLIGQDMAPYCCSPPFVTTVVAPNILISLDNSGSMFDRAYSSTTIYTTDTTSYYGYFKPESMYRWQNNRFVSDPNGPFPGRILNWACMSRCDVAKKVLTGGKGNINGNVARLVSEGRDAYWPSPLYYRRDYSNYNKIYVAHGGNDMTYIRIYKYGSNPPINAQLTSWTPVRVDIPEPEYRGVLDQIGDKDDDRHWDDDAPLFGLWHYNYSEGGYIRDYIGDPDIIDLRNHINDMKATTWTPLAENYFEILHYFSQAPPHYYNSDYTRNPGGLHDPYYDKYLHEMVPCRRSFVLMITDGESTQDRNIPNSDLGHLPYATNLRDYDNDGHDPGSYPSYGSDYLDDICLYGHVNDLRPDPGSGWGNRELGDDQSIEVFVIYAFGTSGSQLLMDAAKNGGFQDMNGDSMPGPNPAEWDKDGDGIPDNYYQAENGYELEEAILKAIMEMLERISSSSGVGVVSMGTKAGGGTAQSQFYPRRTFPTGEVLTWIGTCQSLWLDPYGWLREETEGNNTLHLQNDYVITMKFDPTAGPMGNVVVTRLHDQNGSGDPSQFDTIGTAPIEDLKPIWDGGELLWRNSSNMRNIKAFVDANKNGVVEPGEIVDFTTANTVLLKPYLGVASDAAADTVIQYVRGIDFPGLRERTADGDVWKLGDIINSSAVVSQRPMERYDFIYGDETYKDYYDLYQQRRQVVFVGANDGMLHCFNAGVPEKIETDPMTPMRYNPGGFALGSELWAYIPYNLLPHLKWLKEPVYCHVYYVDLKSYVTDAQIFNDDPLHPHGWGTILIGGMRLGGMEITNEVDTCNSAYFAIDVTDPLNPVPLWEFTDPELDLTFCYSTVAKVDSFWYLLFGSGPVTCSGESNQNARVYVLDLETGSLLKKWTLGDAKSFITNIFAADWGMDYTVDRIYFGDCYPDNTLPGDWGGKIYRILTNDDPDPNNWTLSMVFDMERPITGEGSIATDDFNHLWLYYGSGRFFSDVDEADMTKQRYIGIREDTVHATKVSGLYNVTNVWVDTNQVVHIPGDTISFAALIDTINSIAGWWREFDDPGERTITPTLVFGGAVLFTTFVPTGDICSYGGEGNLWALFYRTGTAYIEPFLEPDTSIRHPEKVSLGPGMPSEPSLYVSSDQTKVFIQAGGGIVSPETGLPGLPKSGVILWKGR
ncbi:hypothetical protein BXT86_01685 [candidate division WOR-3 bacterium 4484_100]|uniref:PilY1 beta-propeller domain-containing protein n=1 Tax=candidate division WOR-3 bacterium 4484_100 TaxID=1936077 RepID=A0A1V4QGH8_UNCW3|nr:MAG: hypothetical protein BXT86_01685 [candidate division WOR-3 bacterium 4484_100]